MSEAEFIEQSHTMLQNIEDIIRTRKKEYSWCQITYILSNEEKIWKVLIAEISFLNGDLEPDSFHEYGDYKLGKEGFKIEMGKEIINGIIKDRKLRLKDSEIDLGIKIKDKDYWNSTESPSSIGFPCNVFNLDFTPPYKVNIRYDPLLKVDEPFYPEIRDAAKEWFRINAYGGAPRTYWEGIGILLPNYKVRITEINIGGKILKIKIEPISLKISDIVGKYWVRVGSKIRQGDINFKENSSEIEIGAFPDSFKLYLISKKSEILDWRDFYSSHETKSEDIKIDVPSEEIKFLINHGESSSIEFKKELGKHNEFLETVVSFANGKGGKILLGVDDNSEIIGIYGNDLEGSIQNIINDRCDPIPEISMDRVNVSDKNILVTTVYRGKNKPYILLGRGAYIRAGSSDRIAKRSELDELYKDAKSGIYR